jgi:replicative DNA helicase
MAANGKSRGRYEDVTEISRGCKVLARELDIPVVALSQLSRAVEQRQDKRPVLSDLRESGGIEQDADAVIFLWNRSRGIVGVEVPKNRHGPTAAFDLAFDEQFTRFSDCTGIYQ